MLSQIIFRAVCLECQNVCYKSKKGSSPLVFVRKFEGRTVVNSMTANVSRVAAVGDFGVLHCHPVQKFDRSIQLQFCTSPPIEATRCYRFVLPFQSCCCTGII